MSIVERVSTYHIRYPDPNDFNVQRMTVLVRIDTSDGVTGWGECIAMWPEACTAVARIVEDGLAPLIIGRDPTETDALWRVMKKHTWWYGEGGVASLAIAGIDIALWDIHGKLAGRPLYELFGGLKQERLPACAANHVNKATTAACIDEVAGFFATGFRSCKLGFAKKGNSNVGGNPDTDVAFIAALREALGEEAEILVDIGNGVRWDVETAIDVANRMADLGVGWLEEPLYPTDDDGYRRLNEATRMPIAAGEREFTATGYRRMIERGSVDIIGVDPARAEGITGFLAVDRLVGAAGATINAHAWSTAVTTAASLHLSLASANAVLFELKPFEVVVQRDLVAEPIWHDQGWLRPRPGAGLGVTVNQAIVDRLVVS